MKLDSLSKKMPCDFCGRRATDAYFHDDDYGETFIIWSCSCVDSFRTVTQPSRGKNTHQTVDRQ